MAFEFKLPDLGEGVTEGEIVRWLVEVGETVAAEQPLVEVMTDKVTAELPSPVAGRVTRLAGKPGDVVAVGTPLLCIETGEAAAARQEVPPAAAAIPAPEPTKVNGGPLAVPAVRRLAKELGVSLAAVRGSGPAGRVLEADVRAAASAAGTQPASPPVSERATSGTGPAQAEVEAETGAHSEAGLRRVPLRGVRRAIADHLLHAHQTTAPYTLVEEIDFTELVSVRQRVQPLAERSGVRLSYLPLILAAVSMALRDHPELNATVDGETGDLLIHPEQHVSIAVHTDEGLQVPVIRNVEHHSLLDLARQIERLAAAARSGTLSREEVQGGTFTVSNLGALGGVFGTPVLNTPQVAILGIHRISPQPVVRGEAILPRQMANVSLTLDHRYLDGAVGAAFAATLRRYVEDPAVMLFRLAELRNPR